MHWNVNSILAHNKLTLLEAYNTVHQYDILCISETYLDSSVSDDDTTLSLLGYNLAPSGHPGNVKRGGVCLYYKEKLSLRMINVSFLSQCVLCEVTLQRQKGYVMLFINLQAKQQLNLMNSYQILRRPSGQGTGFLIQGPHI